MTALENFKNKEQHRIAGAVFHKQTGVALVVYMGNTYTFEEFDKMFPVDHIEVSALSLKGENSDKTKAWMKN